MPQLWKFLASFHRPTKFRLSFTLCKTRFLSNLMLKLSRLFMDLLINGKILFDLLKYCAPDQIRVSLKFQKRNFSLILLRGLRNLITLLFRKSIQSLGTFWIALIFLQSMSVLLGLLLQGDPFNQSKYLRRWKKETLHLPDMQMLQRSFKKEKKA